MNDQKKVGSHALSGALQLVLSVYFLGCSGSVVYFNWEFARDNGFVSWLTLGQIVPTAKATIWPYYAIKARTQKPPKALPQSIQNFLMATDVLVRANESGSATAGQTDADRVIVLLREAVDLGRGIDRAELNRLHPTLGDHFLDDAITASQAYVDGYNSRDRERIRSGMAGFVRWTDWWNANANGVMSNLAKHYNLDIR